MIGFFRRIRKKLADDNQFLKYSRYAVGEIVLVVIGILIALSINNWNEQRKLINKEQQLLVNLKLEMEDNNALIDRYIEYRKGSIEAMDEILFITGPGFISEQEDSLMMKIRNLFRLFNFKPDNLVLDAAKSTNSIELIRNEELKKRLSMWDQTVQSLIDEDSYSVQHFTNSLVPITTNYYQLKNSFSDFGVFAEGSKHANNLEELLKDRHFENSVYRNRILHSRGLGQAVELKKITIELVELIKMELEGDT